MLETPLILIALAIALLVSAFSIYKMWSSLSQRDNDSNEERASGGTDTQSPMSADEKWDFIEKILLSVVVVAVFAYGVIGLYNSVPISTILVQMIIIKIVIIVIYIVIRVIHFVIMEMLRSWRG